MSLSARKLDVLMRITVAVLIIGIMGVGGLFAYNVYVDRKLAEEANPALRAVRALEAEVRERPDDVYLRVRLGEALAAARRYQDAIEQFNAALIIEPKHVGAHLDLGTVALANNREADAVKYFEKVIELTEGASMRNIDPRREAAFYRLGSMMLDKKEYERALGYLKEAARIRRDASDTYLLLSRAFSGLEDFDEAIKYVEYALAFDPNFPQANYDAGVLYLDQGDYLKASEHIRRAIDAAPEDPEPLELLSQLGTAESWRAKADAALKTDASKALEHIKIARRIEPENSDLAVLHAQILERLDNAKAALETYREARELGASGDTAVSAIRRLEAQQQKSED